MSSANRTRLVESFTIPDPAQGNRTISCLSQHHADDDPSCSVTYHTTAQGSSYTRIKCHSHGCDLTDVLTEAKVLFHRFADDDSYSFVVWDEPRRTLPRAVDTARYVEAPSSSPAPHIIGEEYDCPDSCTDDTARAGQIVTYLYQTEDGSPQRGANIAYDEHGERAKAWQTNEAEGDTRPVNELSWLPYLLPELLSLDSYECDCPSDVAACDCDMLFLCEGESAVDDLRALNYRATCGPGGGGDAFGHPEFTAYLTRFDKVTVLMDRDVHGRTAAYKAFRALHRSISDLRIAAARNGNDVRDHLAYPCEMFGEDGIVPVSIHDVCSNWDEIAAYDNTRRADGYRRKFKLTRAIDVEAEEVTHIWEPYAPMHVATLFPGAEGAGKSTVLADVAARLTRGELRGKLYGIPARVLILSTEDTWGAVVRPRLEVARADLARVSFAELAEDEDGRGFTIPRDLPDLAVESREAGVSMVWIDSLVTTFDDNARTREYASSANIIHALNKFAEDANAAVMTPWHLNKSAGNDTAMRMMDSRGFRTAARSIVIVAQDPENVQRGMLALDKQNAGRLDVPGWRYELVPRSYVVKKSGKTAETGAVEWLEQIEQDAKATVQEAMTPKDVKRSESEQWLYDYLNEHGESESQAIKDAAEDSGYSEGQVKRASNKVCDTRRTNTVPASTLWRIKGRPRIQREAEREAS